jgi:hypothetical protein
VGKNVEIFRESGGNISIYSLAKPGWTLLGAASPYVSMEI